MKYFVKGGEYADPTTYTGLTPGTREETYGPFDTYKEAREKWAEWAWRTIDNYHARYRIEECAS